VRNPDGTFAEGNPGRPKGSRNKLSQAFIETLYADFEANGMEAIDRLRVEQPGVYARVIASLVPKEIDLDMKADVTTREIVKEYYGSPEK